MSRRLPSFVFLLALVGALEAAIAEDVSPRFESHFRTGMLSANFSGQGQAKGSFVLPTAFDLELNAFTSARSALSLRAILGMDMKTSQTRYTYAGLGQRYYLFSQGMRFDAHSAGSTFESVPRLRYYAGWDLGLAQVLVIEFGPVLGTYSTIIDYGLNGGVQYQLLKDVAIEGHVGYTMGNGFSSVTITSNTMRFFVGGSLYF